jgi:hypothetical protein
MKVKDEIERLAKEYGKLKEPWVFVSRRLKGIESPENALTEKW